RFRAAGQTKKRRLPVGKRFLKITASIAAAVALVMVGNMFSDHAAVGLGTLASAESAFRVNDWAKLDDVGVDVINRANLALEGKNFRGFFGRDLGEEGRSRAIELSVSGDDEKSKADAPAKKMLAGEGGSG